MNLGLREIKLLTKGPPQLVKGRSGSQLLC